MKIAQVLMTLSVATLPLFADARISEQDYKRSVIAVSIADTPAGSTVHPKNSTSSFRDVLLEIRSEIISAARAFDIDPIHVAAAIAGEHAMNVDMFDSIQHYNLQLSRKIDSWVNRTSDLELAELIQRPEFDDCRDIRSDYNHWYCVAHTWNQKFSRGLFRRLLPANQVFIKFTETYFDPNGMGSTFGLGQMSPLRALMVSDRVANRTSLPSLTFRTNGDSTTAFDAILDPRKVPYYVAATIRVGIDIYKDVARFDVSGNPGITATLYNLGNEQYLANQRYRDNISRIRDGQNIEVPQPNRVGRWVLQNLDFIESIVR